MPKKTHLSDADKALFKQAVKDVQPLTSKQRVTLANDPKIKPTLPDVPLDTTTLLDGQHDFVTEFVRDGLQQRQWREFKQGKFTIENTLDLHGHSIEEARLLLNQLMQHCQTHQQRYILIIHGKGLRSTDKAILKHAVNDWLQQLPNVLAFCPAQARDGGAGATYVLLKKIS